MTFGLRVICLAAVAWLSTPSLAAEWPRLEGPYLGQPGPTSSPQVFAPGIISHGFHELSIAFSPNGDEIFYVMSDQRYRHYALVRVERREGRWSSPEVAEFVRGLNVYSVCFGPDAATLYFSGRPSGPRDRSRRLHDIHRVEKRDGRWSAARRLPEPLNTEQSESSVSVAADGTLYFTRHAAGEPGDLWVSSWDGTGHGAPRKLGAPVNTEHGEARPFIAPDQRYLLFGSNRDGGSGSLDLYVSAHREDGSWSEPVNLGEEINSADSDFGPSVSPDGRFLFFSSYRGLHAEEMLDRSYAELLELYGTPVNGYATLYWVDAAFMEGLVRPDR